MDQIAAVPVPSPSPFASPLDQIPLMNYVPSVGVQPGNLVLVNSITPDSVRHEALLWDNTNGQAAVWNLSDPNPAATASLYGPFPGWTAKAIAQGPDGNARLLWTNTNGQAALWNLADPNPAATAALYGPYPGWTATGFDRRPRQRRASLVGQHRRPRRPLEHHRPQPSRHGLGRRTLLRLGGRRHRDRRGQPRAAAVGQYRAGRSPSGTSPMPTRRRRRFWPGRTSGWTAKRLSVGTDNAAHLLWDNVSGQVAVWNLSDANPAATALLYGPYGGWSGQDLSVGADNKGRLLWDNVSGQNSLWNLADANPLATYTLAGPYCGWTAVSIAAAR